MNLIIVDDEAQIRRWLELLVGKIELPIHIAASCGNGKEALEACRAAEVDIVITDIKMPVMDGIELIRQVKKERPSIQFLILSSYSEFQYASEAIRAGASDYLLKAEVTVEGLREALGKVQAQIEMDRSRDREVFSLKSELHGNQIHLRSLYFADLLRGKESALQEFDAKMNTLRIRLSNKNMMLLAIRSDESSGDRATAKISDPDLLDSAVINIVDEILLAETESGCCFVHEQGTYVAVFNFRQWGGGKSLREMTLQYAHRIAGSLTDFLALSVSIGISLPAMTAVSLGQQLSEAASVLNHKRFYGRRSISWYSDEPMAAASAETMNGQAMLEALSTLLDGGQFTPALDCIREVMDKAGERMVWTEKEVKAYCIEAVFLVQRTLRRLKSASAGAGPAQEHELEVPHEEIGKLSTFGAVEMWLLNRAAKHLKEAEQLRHPYSESIRKVCDYVRAHYAAGVSLQQAADHVHLNRNYLSELFKKELGVSFNDYVTQVRIDKVKELLLKGEMTIGLLAEQVGYPDGSYLSKVFKKMTGMTPLEYKQRKT